MKKFVISLLVSLSLILTLGINVFADDKTPLGLEKKGDLAYLLTDYQYDWLYSHQSLWLTDNSTIWISSTGEMRIMINVINSDTSIYVVKPDFAYMSTYIGSFGTTDLKFYKGNSSTGNYLFINHDDKFVDSSYTINMPPLQIVPDRLLDNMEVMISGVLGWCSSLLTMITENWLLTLSFLFSFIGVIIGIARKTIHF